MKLRLKLTIHFLTNLNPRQGVLSLPSEPNDRLLRWKILRWLHVSQSHSHSLEKESILLEISDKVSAICILATYKKLVKVKSNKNLPLKLLECC